MFVYYVCTCVFDICAYVCMICRYMVYVYVYEMCMCDICVIIYVIAIMYVEVTREPWVWSLPSALLETGPHVPPLFPASRL